jgi:hypothetical protein
MGTFKPEPDNVVRPQPIKEVGGEPKGGPVPTGPSFQSYMQGKPEMQGAGKPQAMSPFELAQGQTLLAAGPTFDSLLTQVKSAQSLLGDINNQLNTKNLKLKQSQRYLLKNKLTDANDHIRSANSKMGAEIPEAPAAPTTGGVLGKFLGFISDGMSNLQSAKSRLEGLKDQGMNLKPADFLQIQLKLAHAQQEIEYCSIMLAKAVEDIKTLFGTQI